MKFGAIWLGLALTAVTPAVASAQHISPLQAAAIAESVVGIAFGVMYPAPRCGPHDAMPRPFQPPPAYNTPPPRPQPPSDLGYNNDDPADDDGDYQPLPPRAPRHPNTYSLQPQTRAEAADESDQTTDIRARDDNAQSGNQFASGGEDAQPAQAPVRHRLARRKERTQTPAPAQSSGQVAVIPSLSPAGQ